jgi:HSP20 family protein
MVMNTSLTRFGSYLPRGLDEFRRDMDTMMNRFFERNLFGDGENGSTAFSPLANVAETENGFEITLDLPGVKPEEVNIEFRQGDLWISGELKQEQESKGKNWHRMERQWGQFRRIISLGQNVDADKVEAEYKDGVLTITIPKAESAKPKRITVRGAESS